LTVRRPESKLNDKTNPDPLFFVSSFVAPY